MSVFSDWTLTELEGFRKELAKAIASGALRVRYADRDVQYRDLEDMRQTAGLLNDAIAQAGGATPLRRVQISSKKGFAA